MQAPWIARVLEEEGYRRLRGPPAEAWVRLPAKPCIAALPGDAPMGLVTRRGGRVTVYDSAGYLEVGAEYPVWNPGGEQVGRVEIVSRKPWGGLEARLLEGEAPLWALVGPPGWWWRVLETVRGRIRGEEPWLVILVPIYTAPYRRPHAWTPPVRVPGPCLAARPPPPGPGGAAGLEWCGGRLGVCGG